MQLGNVKSFKGIGYVCYLDILGFSQDIESNWNSVDENPLEKLLAIKAAMPVLDFPNEESVGSSAVRSYACRVNTISDSITIAFGFEPKLIVGDLILGLEALLANLREVWSTAIKLGYTLRGAIEFGDIYWDENELIGPAFISAYRLESEVARVSRVIVSSKLNKVLADLINHQGDITSHLIANFRKDVDGYVIVSPYLLASSVDERKLLVANLQSMAKRTSSPIISEKYASLISILSELEHVSIGHDQLGKY
ncbi:hypothetical protein N8456_02140 [Porticoccaceae bacterium]|nr:hypothetical protein [Porticoccaceae bacterium]